MVATVVLNFPVNLCPVVLFHISQHWQEKRRRGLKHMSISHHKPVFDSLGSLPIFQVAFSGFRGNFKFSARLVLQKISLTCVRVKTIFQLVLS